MLETVQAPETNQVVANQLVIFGGGFGIDEAERPVLSLWAEQRLGRAIDHYYDNRTEFTANDAIIVCTGWQTPSHIELVTPSYLCEADIAAYYLVRAGVPHCLVEKERASTNTLTNFLNVIEGGFIKVDELDASNPLGFVSHPGHLRRIELFADKIGIGTERTQRIATHSSDVPKREFISRTAWKALLLGATSPKGLRWRDEKAAELLGPVLPIARVALSRLAA